MSPELQEPIRTLPEAIADRLRREWYVIIGDDSEAWLCWTRDEAVRVIAEGQCSWALNVQWGNHGKVSDASEKVARLVLDKLLYGSCLSPALIRTGGPFIPAHTAGQFIRTHVSDWGEIVFEAIDEARAEAEHIAEVSSPEATGRV